MDNLLNIYNSILRYSGLECDKDGYISIRDNNSTEPVLVDGKRLVMPTRHNLAGSSNSTIVFHPLAENVLGKESIVFTYLKELLNHRINTAFAGIGIALLQLAASPEQHKKLNMEQLQFITDMGNVTHSTFEEFTQMAHTGLRENSSSLIVNIYLKRGGTYRNERYSWVGVTTSTFKKHLKENQLVYGVKIKDVNREIILRLIDFLIPEIDTPERYNYGSVSKVAPRLDCLLRTSLLLTSWINTAIETFGDFLPDIATLPFDSEWIPAFDDLESLVQEIRAIPAQGTPAALNTITVSQQQALPSPTQAPSQAVRSEYLPQGYDKVVATQPRQTDAIVSTGKGIDFAATLSNNPALDIRRQTQMNMPYVASSQVMMDPRYQQQQQMMDPRYQQQQPMMDPRYQQQQQMMDPRYQQQQQQVVYDIYGRAVQMQPPPQMDAYGRSIQMDQYGRQLNYAPAIVPPGYPQYDARPNIHPISGQRF